MKVHDVLNPLHFSFEVNETHREVDVAEKQIFEYHQRVRNQKGNSFSILISVIHMSSKVVLHILLQQRCSNPWIQNSTLGHL